MSIRRSPPRRPWCRNPPSDGLSGGEPDWLVWAREIQATAQTGLAFCRDPYDQERYQALGRLAARIMAEHTGADLRRIEDLFAAESGYASPKVGVRGVNDYTKWFASDPEMKGDYGGYDGPCPPWNDSILHHYHFIVYALDVPSLALSGRFTGADAEKAMAGHVLARGEVMGTYTLSPKQMTASSKR